MQMETFLHRTGAGRKRDRSTEIYPQPYVSANLYGFCRCPSPLRGAAPLFPARRDIPNWPLCDSDGHNLLNPGETPMKNAQFLIFLAAVLRAVHKHGINLRLGIIGASNDHRLGANEAPPAVLSV